MLDGIMTWAEIDLDAIAHNVRAFKRYVGARVKLIVVVKANAYGHGAEQVSRAALEAGAEMLAVDRATEGVELRKSGIQAPILVMGYTPPDGAEMVVANHLTSSLMTAEYAQALSDRANALGIAAPVHIKVDTGMSRYGLMPEETVDFLQFAHSLSGITLEGLFTHFSTADWADTGPMLEQLSRFQQVRDAAQQAGFRFPLIHAANSAAAMILPKTHFDAIRPGIAIYGLDPSNEWPPVFEIHPALSLKSTISRVRLLPEGWGVSYSRTYITRKPTLAALIPAGYGDGYHRNLSNKGYVLIHGKRSPIIGRVCMDQFVVDASDIPDVKQDEEVVLIGSQSEGEIRVEDLAALAGTINYEIITSLLPRVHRIFIRSGKF